MLLSFFFQFIQTEPLTNKNLASLISQLVQFQDEAFGRRVSNPALTRLPVSSVSSLYSYRLDRCNWLIDWLIDWSIKIYRLINQSNWIGFVLFSWAYDSLNTQLNKCKYAVSQYIFFPKHDRCFDTQNREDAMNNRKTWCNKTQIIQIMILKQKP